MVNIEEEGKEFGWKEEDAEVADEIYEKTGYPEPIKRYKVGMESFTLSIEETYFWILQYLRHDMGYPHVDKITDIFSASENSAFWGQAAQRLGIQQDKVSGYFATIGKMIKDLFQIIRELRIIDERLDVYKNWKTSKSADVTLKSLYVELVEGGAEKINSVYGLARQVGYTTLPDLFFNTKVYNKEDVDKVVDNLKFNKNVLNVLRKKLYAYVIWAERTEKELNSRRQFTLHYLRQHWGVIKMYMGWVRPYLKTIKRLSMSEKHLESPELITAFESSMLEIEVLARKPPVKGYCPCILLKYKYITKPSLSFQQEMYQRGPIHVGRVEIEMRGYTWAEKEIEVYKKMRQKEDMELLSVIDESVKAAMDALGDDLDKYLAEAGEELKKKETEIEKKKKIKFGEKMKQNFDPFIALFSGFGEMFGGLGDIDFFEKKQKGSNDDAKKIMEGNLWLTYRAYKKSHQLLTW